MLQSHDNSSEATERMDKAAENLKRILEDLKAFERKPKVEEPSTAGTWRSHGDSVPHVAALAAMRRPHGEAGLQMTIRAREWTQ